MRHIFLSDKCVYCRKTVADAPTVCEVRTDLFGRRPARDRLCELDKYTITDTDAHILWALGVKIVPGELLKEPNDSPNETRA